MKNNWSLVAAGWIVVEDQQVVAARVSLVRSGGRTTYKYTQTYHTIKQIFLNNHTNIQESLFDKWGRTTYNNYTGKDRITVD